MWILTKRTRRLLRGPIAIAHLAALSCALTATRPSLAADEPTPAPSPAAAAPEECAQGPGFSRADEYPAEQPITTRLVRLDQRRFPMDLPATVEQARARPFVPANAFEELDDIYSLMALAVVHADWQEKSGATRGYNIGGVIVDDQLEVVNWERNSNAAMCNGTQHGEVRTMVKQLNRTGSGDLKGHQIYTSLEPCMMCSGMMMQSNVLRTVYMQTDADFGKNLERLTLDTSSAPVRFDGEHTGQLGYVPASRPVISSLGRSEFRVELDVAWRSASTKPNAILTNWLRSDEAEEIYRRARKKFENYPLRFADQKASATFIVPMGADGKRMAAPGDFRVLTASKTNAELYAEALALFTDPGSGIIPYVDPDGPGGTDVLVESKANVLATRLLEDPRALDRAEHPAHDPDSGAPLPTTETLVVDGSVAGKHVHQERVRRGCTH